MKKPTPTAFMHTMHQERGHKQQRPSLTDKPLFGRPGHDYDPTYKVTTEPLFTAAELLAPYEHDGELHKAVFMALESYGGADTFRDGVLALVELARERYTEMMAAKDLLRDVERRILKHQATVPMSRRETAIVSKIRADIKRHLGVIK